MSKVMIGVLAVIAILVCAGCAELRPTAFPSEMSQAFTDVGKSIVTQADWNTVLARLNGQVIEPGVEAYAGVLYIAGGKITGTSGSLTIEADQPVAVGVAGEPTKPVEADDADSAAVTADDVTAAE